MYGNWFMIMFGGLLALVMVASIVFITPLLAAALVVAGVIALFLAGIWLSNRMRSEDRQPNEPPEGRRTGPDTAGGEGTMKRDPHDPQRGAPVSGEGAN